MDNFIYHPERKWCINLKSEQLTEDLWIRLKQLLIANGYYYEGETFPIIIKKPTNYHNPSFLDISFILNQISRPVYQTYNQLPDKFKEDLTNLLYNLSFKETFFIKNDNLIIPNKKIKIFEAKPKKSEAKPKISETKPKYSETKPKSKPMAKELESDSEPESLSESDQLSDPPSESDQSSEEEIITKKPKPKQKQKPKQTYNSDSDDDNIKKIKSKISGRR
jgi:hypothetical protein